MYEAFDKQNMLALDFRFVAEKNLHDIGRRIHLGGCSAV